MKSVKVSAGDDALVENVPRLVYEIVEKLFGRSHDYEERLVLVCPDLCLQTRIVKVGQETPKLLDRCIIIYVMISARGQTLS